MAIKGVVMVNLSTLTLFYGWYYANWISKAFEMKCYRNILLIPRIAHRTNSSILNKLCLLLNWIYNFVRYQKLKYFDHVTRHTGLEKTIMQGMVVGKRSRGKPRQRLGKGVIDIFGAMTVRSRLAEDRH